MASPEIPKCEHLPDPEALLAPIPGANPCGEPLSFDQVYTSIRKARVETDQRAIRTEAAEKPSTDFVEFEDVFADWPDVVALCSEALVTRSKDLQLAVWLTEALVELNGFEGLRAGVYVLRGLISRYWDGVYPKSEDDPNETPELRSSALSAITVDDRGTRLPNRLREAPLTPGPTHPKKIIYSLKFSGSRTCPPRQDKEGEKEYAKRKADADLRGQKFDAAVAATDPHFHWNLLQNIKSAVFEIEALGTEMAGRLGTLSPGVRALKEALAQCQAAVRGILVAKNIDPNAAAYPLGGADEQGAAGTGEGAAAAQARFAGPAVRSRPDAFSRLLQASAYLRRIDPNSPVPHLVDRAVAWGGMSFGELHAELLKDAKSSGLGPVDKAQLAWVEKALAEEKKTGNFEPACDDNPPEEAAPAVPAPVPVAVAEPATTTLDPLPPGPVPNEPTNGGPPVDTTAVASAAADPAVAPPAESAVAVAAPPAAVAESPRLTPQAPRLAAAARPAPTSTTRNGQAGRPAPVKIASRGEALLLIEQVAQYLQNTEPNSPVPALLRRAVAWGSMSFAQLLEFVVGDQAARGQVGGMLGLK